MLCLTETSRSKAQYEQFLNDLAKLPTIKEKDALKKDYGLRERHNPFFKLSMDVFRYT